MRLQVEMFVYVHFKANWNLRFDHLVAFLSLQLYNVLRLIIIKLIQTPLDFNCVIHQLAVYGHSTHRLSFTELLQILRVLRRPLLLALRLQHHPSILHSVIFRWHMEVHGRFEQRSLLLLHFIQVNFQRKPITSW